MLAAVVADLRRSTAASAPSGRAPAAAGRRARPRRRRRTSRRARSQQLFAPDVVGDQQDFGVAVGAPGVAGPQRRKLGPQLAEVVDFAVEDDPAPGPVGEGLIGARVGVEDRQPAVGQADPRADARLAASHGLHDSESSTRPWPSGPRWAKRGGHSFAASRPTRNRSSHATMPANPHMCFALTSFSRLPACVYSAAPRPGYSRTAGKQPHGLGSRQPVGKETCRVATKAGCGRALSQPGSAAAVAAFLFPLRLLGLRPIHGAATVATPPDDPRLFDLTLSRPGVEADGVSTVPKAPSPFPLHKGRGTWN